MSVAKDITKLSERFESELEFITRALQKRPSGNARKRMNMSILEVFATQPGTQLRVHHLKLFLRKSLKCCSRA